MTTLIGIIIGIFAIAMAIIEVKAPYVAFISTTSILIVGGGVLASTLISFWASDVWRGMLAFMVVFLRGGPQLREGD